MSPEKPSRPPSYEAATSITSLPGPPNLPASMLSGGPRYGSNQPPPPAYPKSSATSNNALSAAAFAQGLSSAAAMTDQDLARNLELNRSLGLEPPDGGGGGGGYGGLIKPAPLLPEQSSVAGSGPADDQVMDGLLGGFNPGELKSHETDLEKSLFDPDAGVSDFSDLFNVKDTSTLSLLDPRFQNPAAMATGSTKDKLASPVKVKKEREEGKRKRDELKREHDIKRERDELKQREHETKKDLDELIKRELHHGGVKKERDETKRERTEFKRERDEVKRDYAEPKRESAEELMETATKLLFSTPSPEKRVSWKCFFDRYVRLIVIIAILFQ